ncbi:MAG: hypothetical protein ACWA41_06385 [Putridiphycobacter sp.]
MTQTFLKAKHWQIFTLTFGLPFLFQIYFISTLVSSGMENNAPSPDLFFNYLGVFAIMLVISVGTFYGWFWSLAVGLQNKIPSELAMKVNRFKIFFFVPLAYFIIITSFIALQANNLIINDEPNVELMVTLFMVIIPLHLFSIFCMFHNLYFAAKTIKTAELQREVKFSDFAGEFFLIWFYPIGVWILQPQINKLIEPTNELNDEFEVL